MNLKEFLRKKRIYRKFKRNWLNHHYGDKSLSKFVKEEAFKRWLKTWGEHPKAVHVAFHWAAARYGTYTYWSIISDSWRLQCMYNNDYGNINNDKT